MRYERVYVLFRVHLNYSELVSIHATDESAQAAWMKLVKANTPDNCFVYEVRCREVQP